VSKIVLCVDDSVTMQQVADITFRGTAFQYVGARTVDEALGKVKGQKPAIVLADAAMPGKNGYDLCMALKSDPSTADVPVVILVGNSAPYDNAKGTQVGADANLPKPWDTQTMLEKVTEIANKGAQAKPGVAGAAAAPAKAPQAAAAATPAAAPAAAAAAAAKEAPRSATIMGMPPIKMPAGVAPTVTAAAPGGDKRSAAAQTAAPPGAAPDNPATVIGAAASLRPPAGKAGVAQPVATPAKGSPATSPAPAAAAAPASSASPAAAPAKAASAPAAASSSNGGISGMNRSPMVSGIPTKRSVLVERTLAKMAARLAELSGIEPGSPELIALLKLSTEVVERVVWEVVPELAEHIIRENLPELSKRS
jgi:CheY-like chemotaxis protein